MHSFPEAVDLFITKRRNVVSFTAIRRPRCLTDSLTDLLVFQVSDERVDVLASHQSENGSGSISTASSTVSSLEVEKATYEYLAQTPISCLEFVLKFLCQ
jgi:hypothetical protein